MRKTCLLILLTIVCYGHSMAQFQCGANTPTFVVNLTGDPNGTWTSPDTNRNDTCCGATAPDKCVGFEVTLHPNAEGIIFEICDGAIPPGAIFYQVNCGSPTPVGEALCLSGVGPHYITFCKPGNNANKYCITSIAEPAPGPAITVNDGCSGQMYVQGYDPDSLTWTSVYPGNPGDYDAYLDCTFGCDTVNVTGQASAPDTVLYQVCGPLLGECDSMYYCDTIPAYFFSTLEAVISPEEPTVCHGTAGTWIYANGAGGSPPYNFTWNTGSTQDSLFVGVGTYVLEVGDTSGCPPAYDTVVVDSFLLPIQANAGNDTVYCQQLTPIQLNGSVQAASGGYWIGGDGVFSPDSSTLNATYAPGPMDSANGVVTLALITTGNGGCPPDTDTVVINLHSFSTEVSFNVNHVSCAGGANGAIWVNTATGIAISSYTWSAPISEVGDSVANLSAGTYQVVMTDSLGCDSVANITIDEPDSLILTLLTQSNASCQGYNDGFLEVGATGGSTPYAFSWSHGDTTASADSLLAGSYSVTVTDANGCQDSMDLVISEPAGISIAMSGVDVDCHGDSTGAANANPSGPYSTYSYAWSNGGNASIIFNIQAGSYTVTVTYGSGCEDTASVVIAEPDSLELSLSATHVSCFGAGDGALSTSVTGGTAPYTYAWSTTATSAQLSSLTAGTYTLTLTDDQGCELIQSATVTEPDSMVISDSISHVTCNGADDGAIAVLVAGGTTPYTYSWNNGSTSASISNLPPGSYTLIVQDSNGCVDTGTYQVVEPTPLTGALAAQGITCNGGSDGWVALSASGGNGGYGYNWSNGGSGDSISTLSAGPYSVTLTDAMGCVLELDTVLIEPTAIQVQMSNNATICLGDNAVVFAAASGGNGGYSYAWSHGLGNSDSHVVSPSQSTTYTVTVTDTFNCPPAITTVTITVKPVEFAALNVSAEPEDLCLGSSVEITGQYNGSLDGFSVEWNPNLGNAPGTFTQSPTNDTEYIMTVIDDCGFSISDTVLVTVHPVPVLSFPEVIADGCAPLAVAFDDGIDGITISEYQWDFGNGLTSGQASPTMTYFNPGTYEVSLSCVTDMGCPSEGQGTGEVIVRPSPSAAFEVIPEELTTDEAEIETVDLSEDAAYYAWSISDGATYEGATITHTFQTWGDFEIELVVENVFGCFDTARHSVYVDPVLVLDAPTAFTPNPHSPGDGSVDPSATHNDVFYLITQFVSTYHLVIYNRWGETVFESFDPLVGWNGYYKGELAPMSMYVWRVDVEFVNGKKLTRTGNVTLLR